MEPIEHKELLRFLKKFDSSGRSQVSLLVRALQEVVKLHDPVKIADGFIVCDACSNSEFYLAASCLTLRVIKNTVI